MDILNKDLISFCGYPHKIFIETFITGKCNYDCKYCCYKYLKNNKYLNLNQLYLFITNLYKKYKKDIYLSLLGGEPTLHPDLLDFINKISKYYPHIQIAIMSNFSQDISFYNLLLSLNVKLLLTWHSLSIDKYNLHFLNNVKKIDKKYKNFLIHVMFEKQLGFNIYKQIQKIYPYNSELTTLSYNKKTNQINFVDFEWKYTNDEILLYKNIKEHEQHYIMPGAHIGTEIILSDGTFIKINELNQSLNKYKDYYNLLDSIFSIKIRNFKNWFCYANERYLWIDIDGNIYPCFKFFLDKKSKSTIKNLNYKLHSIICPYDKCDQIFEVGKKHLKIFKLKINT